MNGRTYPKTIFIIRHAEKSGSPASDSQHDGTHLSMRGYARAAALAPYFPATFSRPHALFAAATSKHSDRPVETITPLAQALKLDIKADIADADYATLADKILSDGKYEGKVLLVCWHHGHIPALTQRLGGQPPQDPWPDSVFDRVWQLDYPGGDTQAVGLPVQNIAQQLMFGDQPD